MTTRPKVGGYCWRRALALNKEAIRRARVALGKILDEKPGPALLAFYVAEAAQALGDAQSTQRELEEIGSSACQECAVLVNALLAPRPEET